MATSKLKVGRTTDYRKGTDTELIAFRHIGAPTTTTLLLLSGERPAETLRSGTFGVHMVRAKESPVAMAVCMVGDHHWMLAKDALVLRVAPLRYLFALPGFFNGLVLSAAVSAEECRTLEQVFSRFCMYGELGQGSSNSGGGSDTDMWNYAYAEAVKITSQATKTRSLPTLAAVAATAAAEVSAESSETMTRKVQRAVRTSAVVKLMSRSLLTGALDPGKHFYMAAAAGGLNLPSMSSVSDLLEAIETRSIQAVHPLEAAAGHFWHMNPDGVKLMVMVLAACSATGARKRARQALDTLEEEPEEPEELEGPASGCGSGLVGGGRDGDGDGDEGSGGGGGGDERGDGSKSSLRCSDRGAKRIPKSLDVY